MMRSWLKHAAKWPLYVALLDRRGIARNGGSCNGRRDNGSWKILARAIDENRRSSNRLGEAAERSLKTAGRRV